MTINLLLVLLLHTEQDLGRNDAFVRVFELDVGIQSETRGIFEEMRRYGFVIYHVLHVVARLVHAKKSQDIQYPRMHFLATVGHNAYDHLWGKMISNRMPSTYCRSELSPFSMNQGPMYGTLYGRKDALYSA